MAQGKGFNQNSLTLINHASILIKGESKSILCDPWYSGAVFHDGWKLLYENSDIEIDLILANTNYIWVSHEHPDHFSVPFFKKYKKYIIENKIIILFQATKDKRVANFLSSQDFMVEELMDNEEYELERDFKVKIAKDEFYDSALIIKVGEKIIFNLNDCPIHSKTRVEDFKRKHGRCDILLTQFSYAAWKGGEQNQAWRIAAANEKMESLALQAITFNASTVIPFASFVYFSNYLNFYLNDSVNTPKKVLDYCRLNCLDFQCLFLRPLESISLDCGELSQDSNSLFFWQNLFEDNDNKLFVAYKESYSYQNMQELYGSYCSRIYAKNSALLIRALQIISFGYFFPGVKIFLIDQKITIAIDLPARKIHLTADMADISMHSSSLAYIFTNPFGFDTLTVNGNFEQLKCDGFGRLAKNFAIENLNNLGYFLNGTFIFEWNLVRIFLSRLIAVSKKMARNKF